MLTDEQKNRITKFAQERTMKNDEFHRLAHLQTVAGWAVILADQEGCDKDICWAGAMLHDICKTEPGDHGSKGAAEAHRFLREIRIDDKTCDKISQAIEFHNKEFKGGSLERQILWDADKLDGVLLGPMKTRLVPSLRGEGVGESEIGRRAQEEYEFYMKRFKTKSGKLLAEKERDAVSAYLATLAD